MAGNSDDSLALCLKTLSFSEIKSCADFPVLVGESAVDTEGTTAS